MNVIFSEDNFRMCSFNVLTNLETPVKVFLKGRLVGQMLPPSFQMF